MLDPKKKDNVVDYGELLIPPQGFTLRRAIGTTYSLDLQALLAIPVAMFYSKQLEINLEKSEEPLDVFDSISRASKTVTIFCQKGKIKVPRKFNKLMSFTEGSVKEITLTNAFSSFHPKCWWLWFHNPDTNEKAVRFFLTSRNLSFDRCWDVSFSFEGKVTAKIQSKNKSMLAMLDFLNNQSGNVISSYFREQLHKTDFKNDLKIDSWKFHPMGLKNYANPLADVYFRPDVLLMMSPFIDDKKVELIAKKAKDNCWLFSRKCELEKTNPKVLENITGSYFIPDVVVNGEWAENISEEIPNVEPDNLDLHAKLYISRKGNTNTWLLGSANLTRPAFENNIESLIEFKSDDKSFRPEVILKELVSTESERKLFDQFTLNERLADTKEDMLETIIRKLIYDITCSGLSGDIVPDGEKTYFTYNMVFDASNLKIPGNMKIYLRPLSFETVSDYGLLIKERQLNKLHFEYEQKLSQISKYFVFSIFFKGECQKDFLVKAEIKIEDETRYAKILSEIINSKEKFLQYLRFLLSNDGIVDIVETDNKANNTPHTNSLSNAIWDKYDLPLYEELLKTASRHPEKLRVIDELISKLKAEESTKDFISPEFDQLWEVFKKI